MTVVKSGFAASSGTVFAVLHKGQLLVSCSLPPLRVYFPYLSSFSRFHRLCFELAVSLLRVSRLLGKR